MGKTRQAIHGTKDLNSRQQRGLRYLKENPLIKTGTYAQLNHVSLPTAAADIKELVEYGFLRKVGTYRGAYYVEGASIHT